MNLTIVILLLLVFLALLILSTLLLLVRPKDKEAHFSFEDGAGDSTRSPGTEEEPVTIHEACETGNMREFKQWLSLGTDLNHKDENGYAPLHLALAPFQRDVAKYLIDSGANEEIKNWKGISPKTMVQQNIINFLSHS